MAAIVLTTFNARYSHTAFGLRCLLANMGSLRSVTELLEFDLRQEPEAAADRILSRDPDIIGLGVYIWNAALATETARLLKAKKPDATLILGGPEISYETEAQPITNVADYVIAGEADLAFADLCRQVRDGHPPRKKVVRADAPGLDSVALPYREYTDEDVAQRLVYAEASRGCPFRCDYCISSLDPSVRRFPLPALLPEFETLLERGVEYFKFVDRTFNLDAQWCRTLLAFFRERYRPGMLLHFEMVPDRFPEPLKEAILSFPPGALRFEVGIQTFNEEVAVRVGRQTNYARVDENIRFLLEEARAVVHADLIAGLPGETLESFAAGFDRLYGLGPQEIQVGILKRLRGTAIGRHDEEWRMTYSADPPYAILHNKLITAEGMRKVGRFARYWELMGNSGNFRGTLPLLLGGTGSPFAAFMRWSDWLHERVQRTYGIPLVDLCRHVLTYVIEELNHDPHEAGRALLQDYKQDGRRRDTPRFLREFAEQ